MLGSPRALARMGRAVPWLTRGAGGFLVLLGAGMIVATVGAAATSAAP